MHKKTATISVGSIDRAAVAQPPWRKALLGAAAGLALAGAALDAQALALGAVTVRSALGEPLRAEIEIPQISSEEAASFQATLASPQAFRAAGVEYTPALAGARVSLHRRANGQAYLRVVGERPINEPFLGVVIEANWANGRIVRDYTMLIDPPGRGAPPPVTVTQAPVAPAAPAAPRVPAPAVAQAAPAAESTATPRTPVPKPAEARRAATRPAAAPAPAGTPAGGTQVTVQRGDTASGIVSSHAVEGVSLDQMLVALLQANPKAFIGGNVNRMRAGVVLEMPTSEQASAVSPRAARRAVVAQSRDFQAFRRGVAQNAPDAQVGAAGRSSSGTVQAQVQDARAPAPSEDRLTISRGGAPGGAESAAAQSRQAKEQSERVAELNKNISDLARLQSASGAPAAAATAAPTAAPSAATASAPAPAVAAAAASAPVAAASAAVEAAVSAASAPPAAAAAEAASAAEATASTAQAAASAAVAPAAPAVAKPRPAPAPAPAAEPSFLDTLTENPLLPIAGAGLIALLAGFGVYRSRQRKKDAAPLDSSFIESRLQPDSFFGASGGQRVNTRESLSGTGSSSMAYSPSQLDAAGDVDPVAEADVYLAYGRDMQAEEILKEALRNHPGRISIHRKLAEIFAKRRDARALEAIAVEGYEVTRGEGPDWLAITALGGELDPDNPLYKPGGAPAPKVAPAQPVRRSFGADTEPQTAQLPDRKAVASSSVPLDVDLDLDDAPVRAGPRTTGSAPLAAAVAAAASTGAVESITGPGPLAGGPNSVPVDLDLDIDFAPPSDLSPISRPAEAVAKAVIAPAPVAAPAPAPDAGSKSGMIEFDMQALSVDPDSRSGGELQTEQLEDADDDPLGTKLALAQEFHAIGDSEGARSLVKEVIAESSGALKVRAERFLAELS